MGGCHLQGVNTWLWSLLDGNHSTPSEDRILDYEIHHFSLARPPTQPGNETMKGCAWVVEERVKLNTELACKISSKWSILFRGGVGQNRSMAK